MKAVKIAGIRLINYFNDGINWKDHKDIVLDYWKVNKCQEVGYNVRMFEKMFYVEDLPVKAQEAYETWFKSFDMQSEEPSWIEFISGTLNIFYKTKDPILLQDNIWYVHLFQSEIHAREICEEQTFHGSPNLNAFWKLNTNTKAEEVGGRRNGYLFVNTLADTHPQNTKGFYWAVAFQCDEVVRLSYLDDKEYKNKCICWAANAKNMTLLQVTLSGRFMILPTFVKGKAWREDKNVPNGNVPTNALGGSALDKFLRVNYDNMYGVIERSEEEIKKANEAENQRKNAVNTFNDEEVKVSQVVPDINEFIINGNVSPERRDMNRKIREGIREKNQLREREIKKKVRDAEKESGRADRNKRNKLNPFISG